MNSLIQKTYSQEHFLYKRIKSHAVNIGGIPVGSDNPIRIQSMTTTDTMDTDGTVAQTLRLAEAGCEYVRITAPSRKEAHNLAEIRKKVHEAGCEVPLVADIHFTPNAAEIAARIVEKVRVNPGNYADKKRFKEIEYTDDSYQAELDRIHDRFSPLVKICKEHGTAMRIGTNHGSLSDRIMSRYGDTPLGMVESALEFVRICEQYEYYDVVISMKASNPQVMVQAYRMLMQQMLANGRVYPLHLGVTEAGEGEDGRIKSALGISTLLMDGIGDTVRVSLTEEPEFEAPVAQFLVNHFIEQAKQLNPAKTQARLASIQAHNTPLPFDPLAFHRRETAEILNIGSEQVPRVIADIRHNYETAASLKPIGYHYIPLLDKYNFSDIAADFVYFGNQVPAYELPGGLKAVFDYAAWKLLKNNTQSFPLFTATEFFQAEQTHAQLNFVSMRADDLESVIEQKDALGNCVLILQSDEAIPTYDWRWMIYRLAQEGVKQPIMIHLQRPTEYNYYDDEHIAEHIRITDDAKAQLAMASNMSALLVDGLVDGIWLEKADDLMVRAAFGMLQMARLRITKTEYISCPSCGRTLFDLQETTARIRKRTEHLKGVKIGIMGCIVNGPGEMADADYGYVGAGPGKISLYRGQEVVMRNVKTAEAVDQLIELIRSDDKWIEPGA